MAPREDTIRLLEDLDDVQYWLTEEELQTLKKKYKSIITGMESKQLGKEKEGAHETVMKTINDKCGLDDSCKTSKMTSNVDCQPSNTASDEQDGTLDGVEISDITVAATSNSCRQPTEVEPSRWKLPSWRDCHMATSSRRKGSLPASVDTDDHIVSSSKRKAVILVDDDDDYMPRKKVKRTQRNSRTRFDGVPVAPLAASDDDNDDYSPKKNANQKRRKVEQKMTVSKGRVSHNIPEIHELPRAFLDRIAEMNGNDVKLVSQKKLEESDVDPNKYRLLLIKLENEDLVTEFDKELSKYNNKVPAHLLEASNMHPSETITLSKWFMDPNSYFVLKKPWVKVFQRNGFGKDDVVQVWSFRVQHDGVNHHEQPAGRLGLAIVRIFEAPKPLYCTSSNSSSVCLS